MEAKKRDITKEDISTAYEMLSDSFDPIYGGFSHAPKYPTPHNMYILLRYWKLKGEKRALDMDEKTQDALYRGGIFDHIGYGFSRYSTDE